jgi:hypothetical protein
MAPKRKKKVVAKKVLTKDEHAIKIQNLIRKFLARLKMKHVSMAQWGRVFEPKIDQYFFYNTLTGKSQWPVPRWISLWYPEDIASVIKFQKIARGFLGRVRSRSLAKLRYSKFYDQKSDRVYFMNNRSGETFWDPSEWLFNQRIELTPDDQALFDSIQKIKQLEKMLSQKEEEIKEVKLKRFEDLEVRSLSHASLHIFKSYKM